MNSILERIAAADAARRRIIDANRGLSAAQAAFKGPGGWSVQAHIEHLVLSEQRGVQRIWLAAEGLRRGVPLQAGEAVHRGLPIEEVIAKTWKPREKAMVETDPVGEGPLSYWIARYEACQPTLEQIPQVLSGLDPALALDLHYLSGPLDAYQRLEFLRFHTDRHYDQVERLKQTVGFPVR